MWWLFDFSWNQTSALSAIFVQLLELVPSFIPAATGAEIPSNEQQIAETGSNQCWETGTGWWNAEWVVISYFSPSWSRLEACNWSCPHAYFTLQLRCSVSALAKNWTDLINIDYKTHKKINIYGPSLLLFLLHHLRKQYDRITLYLLVILSMDHTFTIHNPNATCPAGITGRPIKALISTNLLFLTFCLIPFYIFSGFFAGKTLKHSVLHFCKWDCQLCIYCITGNKHKMSILYTHYIKILPNIFCLKKQ